MRDVIAVLSVMSLLVFSCSSASDLESEVKGEGVRTDAPEEINLSDFNSSNGARIAISSKILDRVSDLKNSHIETNDKGINYLVLSGSSNVFTLSYEITKKGEGRASYKIKCNFYFEKALYERKVKLDSIFMDVNSSYKTQQDYTSNYAYFLPKAESEERSALGIKVIRCGFRNFESGRRVYHHLSQMKYLNCLINPTILVPEGASNPVLACPYIDAQNIGKYETEMKILLSHNVTPPATQTNTTPETGEGGAISFVKRVKNSDESMTFSSPEFIFNSKVYRICNDDDESNAAICKILGFNEFVFTEDAGKYECVNLNKSGKLAGKAVKNYIENITCR